MLEVKSLVGVAFLVHGLGGLSRALGGGVVLATLGVAVGLGAHQQGLLGGLHVLGLSLPGLQDGVLQMARTNKDRCQISNKEHD